MSASDNLSPTQFHASHAEMNVGDTLHPADHMRLANNELSLDDHVYFSPDPYVAAKHVGGVTKIANGKAHMYEVQPTGPVLDDPEAVAADKRGQSYRATSAHIVRRYKPSEHGWS